MRSLLLILFFFPVAGFACAEHAHNAAESAKWQAEYEAANHAMHEGMNIAYSDDADVDFTRGMIAHHEGAIRMAEIELKYGKDKQTRALAKNIIKAQKKEIADMKAWLAARQKKAASTLHGEH